MLALAALPLGLWAATPLLLALGAFLLQAGVQGAWAMVPAHLNELSPASARAQVSIETSRRSGATTPPPAR